MVLADGGSLVVGAHRPGRGAWLCRASPGCFELAAKRRAFDRAFGARVPDTQVGRLRVALGAGPAELPEVGSEGGPA